MCDPYKTNHEPVMTRRQFHGLFGGAGVAMTLGVSSCAKEEGVARVSAENCLEIARQCENWVDTQIAPTENGAIWKFSLDLPKKHKHNFYYGSAGIIIFYLELFANDPRPHYRDRILQAADELLAFAKGPTVLGPGWAGGFPGIAFVLTAVSRFSGDTKYADGARLVFEKLMAQSQPIGNGVGWLRKVPFFTQYKEPRELLDSDMGATGAGMTLVWAAENGVHSKAKEWAIQVADRLIEVGETMAQGTRWNMTEPAINWHTPNFSHGAGGVGYFMTRMFQLTGNETYLETAISAAHYLQSIEVKQTKGVLVPHGGEENLFYLAHCHGPAGTGKLFYLLTEVTGDKKWQESMHSQMDGLLSVGAPETRGAGYWNNISQCCGDAGVGDYALHLYDNSNNAAHKQKYLGLAQRVALELIMRSTVEEDKRYWVQAEHRTAPEFLQAQTGFMQGAAGVGSFFLHLSRVLTDKPTVKISLPNSPFGA